MGPRPRQALTFRRRRIRKEDRRFRLWGFENFNTKVPKAISLCDHQTLRPPARFCWKPQSLNHLKAKERRLVPANVSKRDVGHQQPEVGFAPSQLLRL